MQAGENVQKKKVVISGLTVPKTDITHIGSPNRLPLLETAEWEALEARSPLINLTHVLGQTDNGEFYDTGSLRLGFPARAFFGFLLQAFKAFDESGQRVQQESKEVPR